MEGSSLYHLVFIREPRFAYNWAIITGRVPKLPVWMKSTETDEIMGKKIVLFF